MTFKEMISAITIRRAVLADEPEVQTLVMRLDLGVCSICGRLATRSDRSDPGRCLDKHCLNHWRPGHRPIRWFRDQDDFILVRDRHRRETVDTLRLPTFRGRHDANH